MENRWEEIYIICFESRSSACRNIVLCIWTFNWVSYCSDLIFQSIRDVESSDKETWNEIYFPICVLLIVSRKQLLIYWHSTLRNLWVFVLDRTEITGFREMPRALFRFLLFSRKFDVKGMNDTWQRQVAHKGTEQTENSSRSCLSEAWNIAILSGITAWPC